MFRFRSLVILATGLVGCIVAIGAVSYRKAQRAQLQQTPAIDATPIQVGAMTQRQKEHSKLDLYNGRGSGQKLIDVMNARPDLVTGETGLGMPSLSPNAVTFSLHDFLKSMAHSADAVVIAEVKAKDSQLSNDGTFIFTDYDMSVGQILKDNPAARLSSGQDITVTRPGGAVSVNGRILSALDRGFHPLAVGKRYLLFLKFLPQTGSYAAFFSQGSFKVTGDKATKLTDEQLPPAIETLSATTLIRETSAALADNPAR